MAPRIPGEDDAQETQDDELDAGIEDEGDEGGEDETADEGGERHAAEEDERSPTQGDGRGKVLRGEREGRESPLARANRLAREARAETDRLSREVADLRVETQRARQPAQETAEQEAARLALMSPEERTDYRFRRAEEAQNRRFAQQEARFADQSDKATFSSLCVGNKLYARVQGEVEQKLAELRRMGQNVDREALAKFIIGERVVKNTASAAGKQRTQGQRNIQRQQVRPSGGQSNLSTEERRRQTARQRLEDVVF